MLSSIFSPFDAAFAESFGLPSLSSSTQSQPKQNVGETAAARDRDTSFYTTTASLFRFPIDGIKNSMADDKNMTTMDAEKAEKVPPRHRLPRFAVELDGLHCFETILPF